MPLQEVFAVVTFASALTKVFALNASTTDSINYLTDTARWKTQTPPEDTSMGMGGGGISAMGATPIVMFTGILITDSNTRILDAALVPFIQ